MAINNNTPARTGVYQDAQETRTVMLRRGIRQQQPEALTVSDVPPEAITLTSVAPVSLRSLLSNIPAI